MGGEEWWRSMGALASRHMSGTSALVQGVRGMLARFFPSSAWFFGVRAHDWPFFPYSLFFWLNPQNADLTNANLSAANLEGANLKVTCQVWEQNLVTGIGGICFVFGLRFTLPNSYFLN